MLSHQVEPLYLPVLQWRILITIRASLIRESSGPPTYVATRFAATAASVQPSLLRNSPMITAAAPNPFVRRLRTPGYLIFGIAMVLPLIDLLVSLMPLRPTTLMWRFGAVGLLASAIGAPLLVLFLIYVLAYFSGDRKVIIACTVIAALIALMMFGGAGTFALDALQVTRRIQAAAQARFIIASSQALFKLGLEGIAALVLAVSAIRTLKDAKGLPGQRSDSRGSSNLLVGRPSVARPVTGEASVIPPASPHAVE